MKMVAYFSKFSMNMPGWQNEKKMTSGYLTNFQTKWVTISNYLSKYFQIFEIN